MRTAHSRSVVAGLGGQLQAACQPQQAQPNVALVAQGHAPVQRQARRHMVRLGQRPAEAAGGVRVIDAEARRHRRGQEQTRRCHPADCRQRRVAPAPSPEPGQAADRPRPDRLVAQEAI